MLHEKVINWKFWKFFVWTIFRGNKNSIGSQAILYEAIEVGKDWAIEVIRVENEEIFTLVLIFNRFSLKTRY